jgi:chromosome segregation protein
MFLHRLDLQGFKSFVDRTEVHFHPGITGVVGPNGCGKTNLSDAIRWVLGEQSAKQLRGDSMEDVIFNGSPKRRPLGLAEVNLTFKNDRGVLPTEYSEVTVTRRVFRSGVSEYLLNKTPCRLKDIRDLFYDTGVGGHAYSIIERSMVDSLLAGNSAQRRVLLEEASGITKYKARKKEALYKLEATEADLVRLNDIVFELERELRSLARQVGKARRYQRLRGRIKELDLQLSAGVVRGLNTREAELAEEWQEETLRREGSAAELDRLEARLNTHKLDLLELERALVGAQGGLHAREQARVQAQHQAVLLRERAAGLVGRAEEARREGQRLEERLAEVAAREAQATEQLERLRRAREEAEAELRGREASLAENDAALGEVRAASLARQQESRALFAAESEQRAACGRAVERRLGLAERRRAAESAAEELEARARERAAALESGAGRRERLAADCEEAARRLAESEQRLAALAAREREAAESVQRLREETAGLNSRLETLLELKRNYEGVSEGVRALLSDARPEDGLLGVVADVLEVPARFLDALEASLGEAAAFVLAEDRRALESAVGRLRARGGGRATIVDLSALQTGGAPALEELPAEVLGRASALVRCEPRYAALVDRLLGSVLVVEDPSTAERLAAASPGGVRFVSRDGEVWERGRVRAGSADNASGLLHRVQEIRELSGRLAELQLVLDGHAREQEARLEELRALEAGRDATERDLGKRRAALQQLEREFEGAAREAEWARATAGERRLEAAALVGEDEALAVSLAALESELEALGARVQEARTADEALQSQLREREERREVVGREAQAARERLMRLGRELAEWEAEAARSEQARQELGAARSAREEEERTCRQQAAAVEAEVGVIEGGLAGLVADEGTQRAEVGGLEARFRAAKEEDAALEQEARRRRFERTELAERVHQLELQRLELHGERERVFERLRAEYEMDPATWEPGAEPEGFDPAAAEKELEEVRVRFRALGPVNLLAVEDFTAKRERHRFLTRQRADLLDAKTQLLEAIERINTTASQLFRETFAQVQENFREVFQSLFEGGEAELRMVGEDPLECEIEIMARPRGKHLQSVSLMSTGERALSAIALLFSLYLVKPSPFCLLDEVDAPLDDANVERFLGMLRRFSGRTQFVVITHNKKTMEATSCLYGVTMQEPGVSQLVSVKLSHDEPSGNGHGEGELAEATAG